MITSIEVKGASRLLELWGKAPQKVATKSHQALLESLLRIQASVQENTPVASSVLRNSFGHTVIELGPDNILGAVGSPLDYAVPVELGTKPHHPPIQPLRDWVESKLHIHESESEAVAQTIAWKIYRHGTEGEFMMLEAMDDNESAVNRLFDQAVKELVAELGGDN